jgi:hypothetical protein
VCVELGCGEYSVWVGGCGEGYLCRVHMDWQENVLMCEGSVDVGLELCAYMS